MAGGDKQDKSLYEDMTLPTAANAAVFKVTEMTAKEQRHVATFEIDGAFLNAEMGHHNVYMLLHPVIAAILYTLDGKYGKIRNDDGTIIV